MTYRCLQVDFLLGFLVVPSSNAYAANARLQLSLLCAAHVHSHTPALKPMPLMSQLAPSAVCAKRIYAHSGGEHGHGFSRGGSHGGYALALLHTLAKPEKLACMTTLDKAAGINTHSTYRQIRHG